MRKVGIIGTGPTGLYSFAGLVDLGEPMDITLFEKRARAGVGMPYDDTDNHRLMLANIASIEIPPIRETYLEWVRRRPIEVLKRYRVDPDQIDERSFLPRVMLGEYFSDQFDSLVEKAKASAFNITVHISCEVVDVDCRSDGVWLSAACNPERIRFDNIVVATGHVWPHASESTRSYFPSPWSGLLDADIPAKNIGILGTSLSAIDAAMAVVSQHGSFTREVDGEVAFTLNHGSSTLSVTLMSRSGVLPEADFYCPIPYGPLAIATDQAVQSEIETGAPGLLDRVFALAQQEITHADPEYAKRVGLELATADSIGDIYFADRKARDPFRWAEYNLAEAEQNRADRHTVPWRYAILRLHEVVQNVVAHLDETDRTRFDNGLRDVFVDNYAAVPAESIRRLLALRRAEVIDILDTGYDYDKSVDGDQTVLVIAGNEYRFDVFIDARGQRPLKSADLPFPTLRSQLLAAGEEIPEVSEHYTLLSPEGAKDKVSLGALPYLIHDNPFIQGITASADIGSAIAKGIITPTNRARRSFWRIFGSWPGSS